MEFISFLLECSPEELYILEKVYLFAKRNNIQLPTLPLIAYHYQHKTDAEAILEAWIDAILNFISNYLPKDIMDYIDKQFDLGITFTNLTNVPILNHMICSIKEFDSSKIIRWYEEEIEDEDYYHE